MDAREQLWHATNDHIRDLMELVEWRLGEGSIQRRWRLAMCAFARRVATAAGFAEADQILDAIEGYIDRGIVAISETQTVREFETEQGRWPASEWMTLTQAAEHSVQAAIGGAQVDPTQLFHALYFQITEHHTSDHEHEWAAQAAIFKDIFGNPFRPVVFDSRWRSEFAVALAQVAYDTRDFSLLPILADALEDGGCDSADVLAHCRDRNQLHVRGCWVVDGVLERA